MKSRGLLVLGTEHDELGDRAKRLHDLEQITLHASRTPRRSNFEPENRKPRQEIPPDSSTSTEKKDEFTHLGDFMPGVQDVGDR